ncbi:MAG TPA: hypothetical protein VKT30_09035 [Caulobacteraceae bacterium]|nr:hypothetical protein [Caulobacteraceae bacterium]
MSEPVGPVSRSPRPRRVGRRSFLPAVRAGDAEAAAAQASAKASPKRASPPPAAGEAAAFAAHVMGGGQKRGLRGGSETLDTARHVYLETEWSGGADRRHPRGKIAKREI